MVLAYSSLSGFQTNADFGINGVQSLDKCGFQTLTVLSVWNICHQSLLRNLSEMSIIQIQ